MCSSLRSTRRPLTPYTGHDSTMVSGNKARPTSAASLWIINNFIINPTTTSTVYNLACPRLLPSTSLWWLYVSFISIPDLPSCDILWLFCGTLPWRFHCPCRYTNDLSLIVTCYSHVSQVKSSNWWNHNRLGHATDRWNVGMTHKNRDWLWLSPSLSNFNNFFALTDSNASSITFVVGRTCKWVRGPKIRYL